MPRKSKTKKSGKTGNAVIKHLSVVLADAYTLAVKTHGFHWNVEGPLFPQLHELFGKQYEALLESADAVAERIRALGEKAPSSFAQFGRISNINESTKSELTAQAMVAALLADYRILEKDLAAGINAADDADDEPSEDMLIGMLAEAQKTAWMLQAMLKGR